MVILCYVLFTVIEGKRERLSGSQNSLPSDVACCPHCLLLGIPRFQNKIPPGGAISYCSCKLNIQKTKIMVSGLITSWQIDGETV